MFFALLLIFNYVQIDSSSALNLSEEETSGNKPSILKDKIMEFRDKNNARFETTDLYDTRIDWELVPKADDKWNGVFVHRCSSALIQTWPDGTEPSPDLPAYVLTAGHCLIPFRRPIHRGQVYSMNSIFDRSFSAGLTFDADEADRAEFKVKTISFATMNLTDLAVVELQMTASKMLAEGYNFYKLSKTGFKPELRVEMVGYPVEGDWTKTLSKGFVEEAQPLTKLWGHKIATFWKVAINSWAGFSGSPVLESDTNEIIGVWSTTIRGSDGYAVRADDVHECFNSEGHFDLNLVSCLRSWRQSWVETYGELDPTFPSDLPKSLTSNEDIPDLLKPDNWKNFQIVRCLDDGGTYLYANKQLHHYSYEVWLASNSPRFMSVSCEDLKKVPRGPRMTIEAVDRLNELRKSKEKDENAWSVFG